MLQLRTKKVKVNVPVQTAEKGICKDNFENCTLADGPFLRITSFRIPNFSRFYCLWGFYHLPSLPSVLSIFPNITGGGGGRLAHGAPDGGWVRS